MRLSKLAEAIEKDEIIRMEGEAEIAALTTDSRKNVKNSLFICLVGKNTDSHECVKEAVKNGAVAIVTERVLDVNIPQLTVKDSRKALGLIAACFNGNPSRRMKIVGITGTNGKTTTSYMFAEILKASGKRVGVIGTLGIRYGRKSFPADLTTPDPIALQETFADMLLSGTEYVVMEVSAHALYHKKLAGTEFSACIFTNLTQDHLDFFGTMFAYKQAKMQLFEGNTAPIAILNGDDPVGREIGILRGKTGVGKTVYYGLNTPVDAFAVITDETLYSSECILNLSDKLCRVSLSMTGIHNVYNALAAAVCAVELGVEAETVTAGLNGLTGVNGRLERVAQYRGADIYVDYAHTPDGLEKSLDALKRHCKGRLICLFGCGGNRDKTKRPLMGEVSAKKSDFSVLTSDNPRYEDPLDILTDVEKGYRRFSSRYVVVPERKRALEYALDFLKKGDVLLVAGKGGETYQEIMGIKYAFNDHDIIEKLLEEKGKLPSF